MANEPNHPYRGSQEPSQRPKKKMLPLELVLTVSAEAYCKANNKELSDYLMVGVHNIRYEGSNYGILVPYLTEIVVDCHTIHTIHTIFRTNISDFYYSGTALIPKSVLSQKE